MALEIDGKVVKILDEVSGQGSNGTWIKQEFVIETDGEYPKKVHFSVWGDRTREVKNLIEGEKIKVSFEPQSREYNERWYTDLRAWRIQKDQAQAAPPPQAQQPMAEPPAEFNQPPAEQEDDLPF